MMTRRRKIETWVVIVLFGFFVAALSHAAWASSEPERATTADSKTDDAKKPDAAKAKDQRKGSLLSRILSGKPAKQTETSKKTETTEKTLTGVVRVEVKVEAPPVAKKKATKKPAAKPAETAKKTPLVVRLRLTGDYPETPESPSPFGPKTHSLHSLLKKFKELGEDKNVAAVVLEIESSDLGSGKIHEIRQGIAKLRAAGKPVYAFLTSVDGPQYAVATACDEVLMLPSGIMMIPGVRAEMTFYKGLLDKVGVQFQVLQMGKYKGAGEPYSRTSMSGPLRESIEAVVDDRYEWFVQSIAKDRKLEDYQVKTLIDRAFFMAEPAKEAGLVDRVTYLDAFLEQLPKELKVDRIKVVSAYESKKAEIDLSGIGGMMKFMQMIAGGEKAKGPAGGKKIAVVYAVGAIVEGKSASSLLGGSVLGSTTLVEALKKANEDPNVVGIVLRIDSPGGSGVASDLIWRETERIKKPLVASMGDVAGSGGYYIAMGADKILAEPGTITGSIGVIGGKFVLGGLYDKLGLTTEVIARGKSSGILSSTKPFSPEEREGMTSILQAFYRQFVEKAAKGRKMSYAQLHKLAQGRIYSGQDAVELGLVDRIGTLDDAIAEVRTAAGLKTDEKVEVIVLPKPKSFLEQLFEDPAASTDADAMVRLAGPLGASLGELQVIQRLSAEPVLMWMPYKIDVR